MPLVERYIFGLTAKAFIGILVILTAVIWTTQALRELDLVTAKGQTIWIFFAITGLTIPSLSVILAPVALFGAAAWALNRLNGDSEIVVMSAAGVGPGRLLRPLLVLALIVSIFVGLMSVWAIPESLRLLRTQLTQVRADVVANILREGQFTRIENNLVVHVRERRGGALLGIFVQDARDAPQEVTYLAERGQIVEERGSTFLVLEDGSVQRRESAAKDPAIVVFQRYAFDLSPFTGASEVTSYKPRERYTSELMSPDANDSAYKAQPGRFRAELHERLVNPLYPVAFMLIAFAALGRPRTTRQSRATAILAAIGAVAATRIAGLGVTNLLVSSAWAVAAVYALPILAGAAALGFAFRRPRAAGPRSGASGAVTAARA
ncbi:LPS export ABC transporter permease LptF [Methylopila turkensis]|uniref:LPS export ABC transporter permease LptF n=1 Tax=Methylopila turkensis TaxID=1437816 RepID=A0A9W6JP55_9HYPH|nr:LPS export ABC transporter permease LptF [Methylopila turkensis]GLK79956.1 LPS export ABC transporter permease LptF [Methylopila turkensis]